LASHRIRPSKSPLASPFFFIQKKDSSLRPVQDYRYLNSITIKNKYPLPLISDLIDKLKNATIFTKFDVRWGYNNVCIHSGDEWKAAFKMNCGLFEPRVMFFGLTNSPATFQAMMNKIFFEKIREGHIVIYLDDILIFSNNIDDHRALVARILSKLCQYKLYLKPEKCEFEKETVGYLEMVVGGGEVRMEEKKVEAVRNWATPSRKRDLQCFLGFVNFYRKFVKDFSKIARPLHELTGNMPWEWLTHHQLAFDMLKDAISDATILHTPRDTMSSALQIGSRFGVITKTSSISDSPRRSITDKHAGSPCLRTMTFPSITSLAPRTRLQMPYPAYQTTMMALRTIWKLWCSRVLTSRRGQQEMQPPWKHMYEQPRTNLTHWL